MNIEKYTERARGFIQSAQSLAMRDGHQQFSTLHVLKVLLDDNEGLASGLIDRAGGNSRAILKATEEALNKLPKVSGSGAGQVYLAPELARAFDAAEKAAEKAGDSFVTVERLLLGLALDKNSEAGGLLSKGGLTAQNLNFGNDAFASHEIDRHGRLVLPMFVNERESALVEACRSDGWQQSHSLDHLARRTANVDRLPASPQHGCTFDDGHFKSSSARGSATTLLDRRRATNPRRT